MNEATAKGVGAEGLAAAAMPVLLHRVQNTTQLVTGLNTLLNMEPDEPPGPEGAGAFRKASGDAHELGWLFGVLAVGVGTDLCFDRREAGGIEPVLRLVRDALRREGRDLVWRGAVPALDGARDGAALCWGLARLAWTIGRTQAPGAGELTFEDQGGTSVWRVPDGAEVAAVGEALADELDGVRWLSDDAGARLEVDGRP